MAKFVAFCRVLLFLSYFYASKFFAFFPRPARWTGFFSSAIFW